MGNAPLLEESTRREPQRLSIVAALALSASGLAMLCLTRQAIFQPVDQAATPTFNGAMRYLSRRLDGRVLLPGDAAYPEARVVWNQLSACQPEPRAVVEAFSERDVQLAMKAVVALKVPFSVKSGGHSKAGYSNAPNGVLISLKRMNSIQVLGDVAKLGPGVHGPDITKATLPFGKLAVIGQCSNVAEGGFVLGGGWGIMTRKHGLGLDNMVSAKVVLASSEVVETNDTHYADLFWALRGAGIGNFGIVTEMVYQLHPAQKELACAYDFKMPTAQAAKFMRIVGSRELPREVHFVLETIAEPMEFSVLWQCPEPGCVEKGQAYIRDELGNLVDDISVNIFPHCSWEANTYGSENTMLVQSYTGYLKPQNVTEPILKSILDTLYEWTTEMNASYVMPDIEMWGGRIADFPSDATAFGHRDAVYNVAVVVEVPHEQPEIFEKIVERLNREWYRVGQFLDGAYINYQMASLSAQEYPYAYWGKNVPRLQEVKRKYDPENLFTSPQGIPLP